MNNHQLIAVLDNKQVLSLKMNSSWSIFISVKYNESQAHPSSKYKSPTEVIEMDSIPDSLNDSFLIVREFFDIIHKDTRLQQ